MSNIPPVPEIPVPPVPGAAAPPAKKGKGPLFWILLGCGGLTVMVIIVVLAITLFVGSKWKEFSADAEKNPTIAAARFIVKMNPDLEEVESDADAGTITIRNKKTGETITMNAQDIKDGKLSFKTSDGEEVNIQGGGKDGSFTVDSNKGSVSFGGKDASEVPDWVPRYSGVEFQGVFHSSNDEEMTGTVRFNANDSLDDVINFYRSELESAGYQIETSSFEQGGNRAEALTATSQDGRTVSVHAVRVNDRTDVTLSYSEKKAGN